MAAEFYNPSVKQVPRNAPAPILPASGEVSILTWLEREGRLRPRDGAEKALDEAENEEISDLMGNDDSYDDDDMSLDSDDDDDDD